MDNNYSVEFKVNLGEYEGPIDLLLELARSQKVDLSKISILTLANQYLEFIKSVQKLNLEVASDYLVMAAWLTYLKSKLLIINKSDENQPTTLELEEAVKFQLKRLELIQNVSKKLFDLPQIGQHSFYRGFNKDGAKYKYKIIYSSTLYDLFKTYTSNINKTRNNMLKIEMSDLYTVDDAIKRLSNLLGNYKDWIEIKKLLPLMGKNKIINKSALSSTFVATLELARNGIINVKQDINFGPIYIKIK